MIWILIEVFIVACGLTVYHVQTNRKITEVLETALYPRIQCAGCGQATSPDSMRVDTHVDLVLPYRSIKVRYFVCEKCQGVSDATVNAGPQ